MLLRQKVVGPPMGLTTLYRNGSKPGYHGEHPAKPQPQKQLKSGCFHPQNVAAWLKTIGQTTIQTTQNRSFSPHWKGTVSGSGRANLLAGGLGHDWYSQPSWKVPGLYLLSWCVFLLDVLGFLLISGGRFLNKLFKRFSFVFSWLKWFHGGSGVFKFVIWEPRICLLRR